MLTPAQLGERFPHANYHPKWQLVTWHPTGVLNDERADLIVEYIELAEESGGPAFNRYFDMTGYSRIQIGLDHVVRLARRRRRYQGPQVRSAIYGIRLITLSVARMYQELMDGSAIEVGIFRDRALAAEWLKVPDSILVPKELPAQ